MACTHAARKGELKWKHAKATGQNTGTEPNPVLAEARLLSGSKRVLPHTYENVAGVSFLNFSRPSQIDTEILF